MTSEGLRAERRARGVDENPLIDFEGKEHPPEQLDRPVGEGMTADQAAEIQEE